MTAPKPTLGYHSRTAAVVALRRQGLSSAEIAERIGITPKIVMDLETSAARRKGGSVALDARDFERLAPYAARRGIGAAKLAQRIIRAVLDDRMVDAVLDDLEAVE